MFRLYEVEREREAAEREDFARIIGREVARLLLPAWGYELKEAATPRREQPERFIEITVKGKRRRVPEPPPGWVYDGAGKLVCLNPGEGHPIGDTGLKTVPSPRVIGGPCEHPRESLRRQDGGGMRCADCGTKGIY